MDILSWFPFFDQGQKFIIFSKGCMDLSADFFLVTKCSIAFNSTCFLFYNSAFKVHDSMALRNIKMTQVSASALPFNAP